MKTYYQTHTGPRVTMFTSGRGTSTTNAVVTARIVDMNVAIQEINGDFKTPTAFTFTKSDRHSVSSYELVRAGSLGVLTTNRVSGQFVPPLLTPSSETQQWATMEDEAMGRIYDQLKAGANLAVDIAERKQTFKLVKNVLIATRTIRDIVRKLKREPWNVPAELWLTYRYGIMPLVYTTYDVLDAILKRERLRDTLLKGRAKRVIRDSVISKTGLGSFINPRITTTRDFDSSRVEIGIVFKRPTNGAYDWTSLNPIGIAWELLPLSFVADWFVNVGDCLSSWENFTLFASDFRSGYRTRTQLSRLTQIRSGLTNSPVLYWPSGDVKDGAYFQSLTEVGKVKISYKARARIMSVPLPSGLSFRVNLNAKRYADAASLLKVMSARSR